MNEMMKNAVKVVGRTAKQAKAFAADVTFTGWTALVAVVALIAAVVLFQVGYGIAYLVALAVTIGAALVAGDGVLNHLHRNGAIKD